MITDRLRRNGIAMRHFSKGGRRHDEEYNVLRNIFYKSISYAKSFFRGKILISASCITLLLVFFWTGIVGFGYNVYLDDEYLGRVADKQTMDALIKEADSLLPESVKSEVNLFPVLLFFGSATPDEEIVKNTLLADGQMFEGAAFRINDDIVFAVESSEELQKIVDLYTAPYVTEATINVEIEGGVSEAGMQPVTHKLLFYEAYKRLGEIAPAVITTEAVSVTEPVERPVEKIESGADFVGSVVINSEGSDGEKEVAKTITKKNGEVTGEEVLYENIVAMPVARVETIGTKIPDGHGSGNFIRPVGGEITSEFGSRWGKNHNGTDFAGNTGDAVRSADSGTVVFSGQENGFGNLIIIDHKNGYKTYYAHLNSRYVSGGDIVESGKVVGEVGNTGNSTGPHLHLEIHKDGTPVNPMEHLK